MDEPILRIERSSRVVDIGGRRVRLTANNARRECRFRQACDRYATASIAATLAAGAQLPIAEAEERQARLALVRAMAGEDVEAAWVAGLCAESVATLVDIQRDLGLPLLNFEEASAALHQQIADNDAECEATGVLSVESQLRSFRLVHHIGYEAGVRLASLKEKP
ncbi:MAG: hypothetical protein ACYCW6_21390 [Candidatus Xenobia bacterium]